MLAGREVELAVVAEVDRAAVVLGVRVLRILVEDELAAGNRPVSGALAVKRDRRSRFGRPERVEDVVVVVGGEIRDRGRCRRSPAAHPPSRCSSAAGRASGSGCVYGGGRTLIVPASSATSMRPSGRNSMFVGRLNPVARTSFWKWFVFATLTVTGADVVGLPAASRARAVSVCAPFETVRVSQASPYGASNPRHHWRRRRPRTARRRRRRCRLHRP